MTPDIVGPIAWRLFLPALALLAASCGKSTAVDRVLTLRDAQRLATASMAAGGGRYVIVGNDLVLAKLNARVGSPSSRASTRTTLGRMEPYRDLVQGKIRQYGAITELLAVPLQESGYQPDATSGAGAKGIWQFLSGTAQEYGLTVNGSTDERTDPDKSTDAAIRYFIDLHARFNNWDQAIKAYNIGPAGLQSALDAQGTHDVWNLERVPSGGSYLTEITTWMILMRNPSLAED